MSTLMLALKCNSTRFCRFLHRSLFPRTSQGACHEPECIVDQPSDRFVQQACSGSGRRPYISVWIILFFLLVLHGTSRAAPRDPSASQDILAQSQVNIAHSPILIARARSRPSPQPRRSRTSGRCSATSNGVSPLTRKKCSGHGANRSLRDRRRHENNRGRYASTSRNRTHEPRVTPSILTIPDDEYSEH